MPILVTCPSCKAAFNVSEKFAGKQGPCPKCKATITVPKLEEQVKIHAPDPADMPQGVKTKTGRVMSAPIKRQERKNLPLLLGISGVGVLATFAAAWFMGDWVLSAIRSWNDDGDLIPVALVWLVLLALSVPIVVGAYAMLRDIERDPYRGRSLWIRATVCSLVYAALWIVYFFFAADGVRTAIILPAMLVVGAGTAYGCWDLEAGNALVHYLAYWFATLLLGLTIGVEMPWDKFRDDSPRPATVPGAPEGGMEQYRKSSQRTSPASGHFWA